MITVPEQLNVWDRR